MNEQRGCGVMKNKNKSLEPDKGVLKCDEAMVAILQKYLEMPKATFEELCREIVRIKSLEPKVEVCICSAVYDKLGDIWRGHRHGDCMETMLRCGRKPSGNPEHQGFITSSNRYVTREEGRKLQDEAGIKSADKEGYRGNTLFSEDLY